MSNENGRRAELDRGPNGRPGAVASGGSDRSDHRSGPPRSDRFAGGARDGGDRGGADRRAPKRDEPELPDDVFAADLDTTVRRDLLSLDKTNAEAVARHLVMTGRLLEDDPEAALAHARAARSRAGRVAAVREAAGIAAYQAGEWAEAVSDLRAARRMTGAVELLPLLADCERGLGRPERAIELAREPEARALTGDVADELRMVVAGARRDLGKPEAALVSLQTASLDQTRRGPTAARLFYLYADLLLELGRRKEAIDWFLHTTEADPEGETDAEERLAELGADVPLQDRPDDVIDLRDGESG